MIRAWIRARLWWLLPRWFRLWWLRRMSYGWWDAEDYDERSGRWPSK